MVNEVEKGEREERRGRGGGDAIHGGEEEEEMIPYVVGATQKRRGEGERGEVCDIRLLSRR